MLEAVALPLVKYALSEDVGTGDITTLNAIRSGVRRARAIVAKQRGVIAGARRGAPDVPRGRRRAQVPRRWRRTATPCEPGAAVAQVDRATRAASSRPSAPRSTSCSTCPGVATLTRRYVDAIAGTGAIDPRHAQDHARAALPREVRGASAAAARTTASRCGTCTWSRTTTSAPRGGITAAIDRITRTRQGDLLLEVEVESLDQLARGAAPRGGPHPRRQPAGRRGEARGRGGGRAGAQSHPPDSPRMRPARGAGPRSRCRAASTSTTSARTPRPAWTTSRSARSRTRAPALDLSLEIEEVG